MKICEDFDTYHRQKHDERNRVVAGTQRAVNVYKELIQSMGEETKAPSDVPIVDFMEWLDNELDTVSDYMAVWREYTLSFCFMPSFKTWKNVVVTTSTRLRSRIPSHTRITLVMCMTR